MANGDENIPFATSSPSTRVVHFDVHLVLVDAVTRQLRQSPSPTGRLSVNTTERTVVLEFRRKRTGSFVRTFRTPHKCVVVSLALQIWSRVSKCTVRCRFVNERGREGCIEMLQLMGVRVIDLSPQRFVNKEAKQEQVGSSADQYAADFERFTTALSHPQRSRDIASCVSTYSASDQLAGDIATISRAFFGGSVFDA